jgi:hypothetical protein
VFVLVVVFVVVVIELTSCDNGDIVDTVKWSIVTASANGTFREYSFFSEHIYSLTRE